jgi:hypothetical protein
MRVENQEIGWLERYLLLVRAFLSALVLLAAWFIWWLEPKAYAGWGPMNVERGERFEASLWPAVGVALAAGILLVVGALIARRWRLGRAYGLVICGAVLVTVGLLWYCSHSASYAAGASYHRIDGDHVRYWYFHVTLVRGGIQLAHLNGAQPGPGTIRFHSSRPALGFFAGRAPDWRLQRYPSRRTIQGTGNLFQRLGFDSERQRHATHGPQYPESVTVRLTFPCWLLILPPALPWIWWVSRRALSRQWRAAGRCHSCGYILAPEIPGCPECGVGRHD